MTIQWFPGHMTRARKLIVEALKKTDVVLEICDARAPLSSRNPLLGELLGEKPRVLLLNKADLAGKACVQAWKQKLALERWPVLGISCSKRQGLDPIRVLAKKLSSGQKWFGSRAVRVLVAGIPNVGKSTLINALARAKKTARADHPGHTRGVQRVGVGEDWVVLDTPGLLWHKFDDPDAGLKLALLGTIRDEVLDTAELAGRGFDLMASTHRNEMLRRYGWSQMPADSRAALEDLARKRVPLLPGGVLDLGRAGLLFLKDLREGFLGSLCLD